MKVRHKRHLTKRATGGAVMPKLVSGNPEVVKSAKETKSIGEVPGIYAKGRLDKKPRAKD